MIKGDDLLREDTSHIINEVNNTHKEYKKELKFETQLIITIIMGILIVYAGYRTAYYVYIVPNDTNIGEVLEKETAIDVAEELLLQVPYNMEEVIVYNDYGTTNFSELDTEFIVSFIIANLDSSEYMNITSCSAGETCIEVTTQIITNKYLSYYGDSINYFPEEISISNGLTCVLNDVMYDCSGEVLDSFSGKISEVESVRTEEEYIYIYETALFVSNLDTEIIEDVSYTTFNYVSLKPSIASAVEQDGIYEVSSLSLEEQIYNLYFDKAYLYMHTFVQDGDDYYWVSTQVVTELP